MCVWNAFLSLSGAARAEGGFTCDGVCGWWIEMDTSVSVCAEGKGCFKNSFRLGANFEK